jgi:hypothetical protein
VLDGGIEPIRRDSQTNLDPDSSSRTIDLLRKRPRPIAEMPHCGYRPSQHLSLVRSRRTPGR